MPIHPLIASQNHMFMTLAETLNSSEAKDSNLIFSPLSIHVVLSLLAAGSSGSTKDQLLSFLGSESTDDLNKLSSEIVSHVIADGGPAGGPVLQFANGAWVDRTFLLKQSFKEVVTGIYGADCQEVDFFNMADEVASTVNSWAENQTNGLIKEMLPPGSVDKETILILANALYFKGTWDEKFDSSATKEGYFHIPSPISTGKKQKKKYGTKKKKYGPSVKVPFMTTEEDQFLRTYEDCKVLRLPYQQGIDETRQFSMYVFLPHETNGLPTLIEKLKSQPGFLDNHLPFCKVKVGDFKLPRFKISFGFEVSNVLKSLGIEKPFRPGGFTEMVDSSIGGDGLCVSSIFQKSFIEVNEEGTEAAAATAATMIYLCATTPKREDFVADHPFMFVIREDATRVLLFIGYVMNPSI